MNTKTVPFTSEQLEAIIAQYPTPFHIYDEEGIVDNMKRFISAFSWNKGFKQYFAVKATPNPIYYAFVTKSWCWCGLLILGRVNALMKK